MADYSGGDILAAQKRQEQPFSVKGVLNDATNVPLVTVRPNHTIYVQKVVLSITTHAVKFAQVMDDNGTPFIVAKHNDLAAAAGVPSVVEWDFGPHGIPITAGKSLLCVSEASGPVGFFYVVGYQKLTSVVNTGTANTSN